MKNLLFLLCFPFLLTACSYEAQAMWEAFKHDSERVPVKVVQDYSSEAQTNFNKGNAIGKRTQKRTNVTKTTVIGHQRINTTACNDLDDWYLDGFRVGKSFRTQKTEMLQKRIQYCQGKLPNAYQNYWENGFQIGVKS